VQTRIAPSTKIAETIDEVLAEGVADAEKLAEIGRLGAQFILQRALEEEVAAFLGRARYERTPDARGSRNGARPRRVQTGEGEFEIQVPQLRNTVEQFVSKVIPDARRVVRTRPLESLVIGAYVRGLSDRDVESLLKEAGLGSVSKSTVSRICRELRARYEGFRARSLADVDLMVLFVDAVYLPTRPTGRKEWWRGDTTARASVSSSMSAWASESGTRTGLRWGEAWHAGGWLPLIWLSPTVLQDSSRPSPNSGRTPTGNAARCTSFATSWPSCLSAPSCTNASGMPTWRPLSRRRPRKRRRRPCARWSRISIGHTPAPVGAWPRISPPSASICAGRCTCASVSGPQTCWSGRWSR
jgi:Transposase, Mutator family